jgi:hypothetical protein
MCSISLSVIAPRGSPLRCHAATGTGPSSDNWPSATRKPVGDALGHRPAYKLGIGAEAGAIAFVDRLSVAQDQQRARLADIAGIVEQRIGLRLHHRIERRERGRRSDRHDIVERCTQPRCRCRRRHAALPGGVRERPATQERERGTCQQEFFRDHGRP